MCVEFVHLSSECLSAEIRIEDINVRDILPAARSWKHFDTLEFAQRNLRSFFTPIKSPKLLGVTPH